MLTNSAFCTWLGNRLITVYKEHPNTDFVSKLNELSEKLKALESIPADSFVGTNNVRAMLGGHLTLSDFRHRTFAGIYVNLAEGLNKEVVKPVIEFTL